MATKGCQRDLTKDATCARTLHLTREINDEHENPFHKIRLVLAKIVHFSA